MLTAKGVVVLQHSHVAKAQEMRRKRSWEGENVNTRIFAS